MKILTTILATAFGFLLLVSFPAASLPAFQDAPISGDPGMLGPMTGHWYDLDGSVVVAKVRLRPRPLISLRLPEGDRLVDARLIDTGIELVLRSSDGGLHTVNFRLSEEGYAYFLPPGMETPWCGTCTPPMTRSLPRVLANRLMSRAQEWSGAMRGWLQDRMADA